ncbi:hypothetical protein CRG98_046387 [Punica granatum]|uniref:Protein kinase domain-containing protein n=1 Tax=Punica granatum TaxID=22663 RepID=A0A2I0HNE7_PUNGR|nr:hypothetical protein CRG98_046387 [Punica granatum]
MELGVTMHFKSKVAIAFILFVITLPPTPSGSPHNIYFDYPNISSNNREIVYQGDAYPSNGSIEVTANQVDRNLNFSIGRAVYGKPMHLWDKATGNTADFATQFSFAINSQNKSLYADGLAFFLAPNGSDLPERSDGGLLGLVSAPHPNASSPDYPFVAIEFDTYTNDWDPNYTSIEHNVPQTHVGIDINSVISVTDISWRWSNIPLGRRLKASVTYNSSSHNLSVVLTDGTSPTDDTNSTKLWYRVQLKDWLPEWVTFGFSATTGAMFELHTIYSWKFSSNLQVADQTGTNVTNPTQSQAALPTPGVPRISRKSKTWIWAIVGAGTFVIIIFSFLCRPKERKNEDLSEEDDGGAVSINEEFEKVAGPRKFSYEELVLATDNFAGYRQLGEGGFGKVYEGYLSELKSNVAIKKVTPDSAQGEKEYIAEVKTVSQLRHRSLVQLVGWCHRKKELLLIYEFMSNGSLDTHLFKGKSLLTWGVRYKIAQDMASALLYLHEEWAQCVVHRDIKCSNIMLDSSFNAKLGDFGLARLVDHGKGSQTTIVAGTMGYMAPEYLYTGKASKESDIYSFGVVALEIACGRKVFEPRAEEGRLRLIDWVWGLYGTGNLMEAADSKLGNEFDVREMECLMMVGLWCAHPDYTFRPSMQEVLGVLKFDALPPVLPSEMPTPTYSYASLNSGASPLKSSYGNNGSDGGTKSSTFTTSSCTSATYASTSSSLLSKTKYLSCSSPSVDILGKVL